MSFPFAHPQATLKPRFHGRAKPLSRSLRHGIVAIDSDLETCFSLDISWPLPVTTAAARPDNEDSRKAGVCPTFGSPFFTSLSTLSFHVTTSAVIFPALKRGALFAPAINI